MGRACFGSCDRDFRAVQAVAVLDRLPDARQRDGSRGCGAGGFPTLAGGLRERDPFAQVLPLEDRCPTLDRSAALRESPPRRVLRSLAPRAHRDRRGFGLGRRPGRDALDGVYGAPREPHARRAGGVPVAGGLRLRLCGDSPARRQERGQLPPDLAPRAPVRGGAPASRARPSRRSVSWTAFSKRA